MPGKTCFLWLFGCCLCLLCIGKKGLQAQKKSYVFEHINRENGLASNTVPAILQDRQGFLWFGTNNGLQRYDGEKFTTYHYQPKDSNSLASDIIESLLEDTNGNLWIASSQAVTLFSPQEEKFTRIPLKEKEASNFSFKRWILTACDGRIFLSSLLLPDALYVYDAAHQAFIPYLLPSPGMHKECLLQNRHTSGLLKGAEPYVYLTDHAGNTWAAGDNLQVRYKGRSHFEPVQSTHLRYGITYNLVYTIMEDREGTLWAGTDKGIYYFNPQKQHFFPVAFPATTSNEEAAVVTGFLETSDKKIWVSSLNKGIAVYNQQFQVVANYPDSKSSDHTLTSVWCVAEEEGGTIWAGCRGGQLARISPEKIEYYRSPAFQGQSPVKGASDTDGIIWWGTDKGLLIKHIPSAGQFDLVPVQAGAGKPEWGKIKRILPGKGPYVWVATERGGILEIEKATGRINHRFTTETKPGLLSNEIGEMSWYTDSTLAVTSTSGIHFIHARQYTIRTLSTENGLPSNAILDILPVNPQRFFFTTQSSLNSYHEATRQSATYGVRDGILHESFAYNTGYQLSDGRILLGTLQNFFYFHPDSLFRKQAPPQVLITGFSVFDREIPLHGNGEQKNALHLAYDQNFFQIAYASLSYYEANKIHYYYKLEGVDQEWVNAGKVRFASYTGIPGGTYLFKVKAERDDGSITPVITTLTITVALPFWKSPWFALGILLLTGVGIVFIYKIRLNRLLAMQQVRSRIAQDLHDDMGSTLSTIHILSELARQQASIDAGKTKGYVSKINIYSQQMLQAIDDIVWSINPFNDSLQNLTVRMREFATELLESNGIAFDLQVDPLVATQPIPMEARYDYFMIYKEAIHNAARHAQATNVQATIAIQHQELVLTIQDDGKGFDQDSVTGDKGGNGLLNMQNRAKAIKGHLYIDTKPGTGTKVTLKAPLSKSWNYFTKRR